MDVVYKEMTIADYDQVYELWRETEGIGLSAADTRKNILIFLERNRGMSFVCKDKEKIVGTILTGHDGRRGYIYHLVVDAEYRRKGIARALAQKSLEKLGKEGINKCHLFVFIRNEVGKLFWQKNNWLGREDIMVFSKNI